MGPERVSRSLPGRQEKEEERQAVGVDKCRDLMGPMPAECGLRGACVPGLYH